MGPASNSMFHKPLVKIATPDQDFSIYPKIGERMSRVRQAIT
jgi:hypothetical protein